MKIMVKSLGQITLGSIFIDCFLSFFLLCLLLLLLLFVFYIILLYIYLFAFCFVIECNFVSAGVTGLSRPYACPLSYSVMNANILRLL